MTVLVCEIFPKKRKISERNEKLGKKSLYKSKDKNRQALCFAGDPLVHDAGRGYHGRDATRSWKHRTTGKYKHVVEFLNASVTDEGAKLCVQLTSDFPGSPVELDCIVSMRTIDERCSFAGSYPPRPHVRRFRSLGLFCAYTPNTYFGYDK
jgi:hypothetical protein